MNILITGGSGFIGRNLIGGLKDQYKLFAPSHKELDLLDYGAVERYIKSKKIKIVIHSAIQNEGNVFETTLKMYLSIYRNIERLDKFIHLGSGAEFNKERHLKKVKEEEIGKFIPNGEYGLAKYICGEIGKNNKKVLTLRLFGVYGEHEGYKFRFISNSIVKNLFEQPIIIRQNAVFDYTYIDDVVKIVAHFIKNKNKYPDYNVAPTKSITLVEIAEIINSLAKKKSKIKILKKGFNYSYTGSNKRLLNQISSFKFTSYTDGISKLYKFYLDSLETLDRDVIIQDDYLKRKVII